jgi:hypothetical protein
LEDFFANLVCSLLCISYFWLLPESVRWLLAKGKKAEAEAILTGMPKSNSFWGKLRVTKR